MPLIAALLNAGRPVSVGYAATGGSEDGEEGEGGSVSRRGSMAKFGEPESFKIDGRSRRSEHVFVLCSMASGAHASSALGSARSPDAGGCSWTGSCRTFFFTAGARPQRSEPEPTPGGERAAISVSFSPLPGHV